MPGDIKYCAGCDDDFYNHNNKGFDGKGCWSLESAHIVVRYKLHWWTAPTVPGAYEEIVTNSCHNECSKFAFHKQLPDFVDKTTVRGR